MQDYSAPIVTDLGTFANLTRSADIGVHVGNLFPGNGGIVVDVNGHPVIGVHVAIT